MVCEIEQAAHKVWLNEITVIMATDNQVVQASIYKGNSSSPKLFDLIVRLKLVEFKVGMNLIVTGVSGSRMKLQGTDDVSRGSLKTVVTVGNKMIDYCPWGNFPL